MSEVKNWIVRRSFINVTFLVEDTSLNTEKALLKNAEVIGALLKFSVMLGSFSSNLRKPLCLARDLHPKVQVQLSLAASRNYKVHSKRASIVSRGLQNWP